MNIFINGTDKSVKSTQLDHLLVELGYRDATVATAINGDFVPLSLRHQASLKEGDKLEILAPMQGG